MTYIGRSHASAQLVVVGRQDRQPDIVIDADDGASYQVVAHVIADARKQGMHKIGFFEQP